MRLKYRLHKKRPLLLPVVRFVRGARRSESFRHNSKSFGLVAVALVLIAQMILSFLPKAVEAAVITSTIDTSTSTQATAQSNQRKLDRTQNDVLWASFYNGGTADSMEFWYSTNDGVTWNFPGISSTFGFTGACCTSYAPSISFFIDIDDYAHVVYKDRDNGRIMYRRGTPNAGRTAWTWTSAYTVDVNTGSVDPDLVAHREGTGWKTHVLWTNGGYISRSVIDITSGGAITVGSSTNVDSFNSNGVNSASIDFHHNGDSKTVQAGTPHLYLSWSTGATGSFGGVRFVKITYSGGTWSVGTVRILDTARYKPGSSGYWMTGVFDGTKFNVAGTFSDNSSNDTVLYERDAADTTTSTFSIYENQASVPRLGFGSVAYDQYRNIYLFGRHYNGSSYEYGYIKWDTTSDTADSFALIATASGSEPHFSAKRGYMDERIEAIYGYGNSSPYSINFWSKNANSVVLTSPNDNGSFFANQAQGFSWDYIDTGTQAKYAFRRILSSGITNYNYTGSAQTYVVPAGVTSVTIESWGAAGATSTGTGGLGGYSKGILSVTPGETLNVYVGGAGSVPSGTAGCTGSTIYGGGGWNGGGNGAGNQRQGGGGGGASDVRQGGSALANRVIVAGGGGGGANGVDTPGYNGGAGGGSTGGNAANGGGTGGTQSSGGTSGGGLGQGGTGGTDNCNRGGGGGGGGYYGGGGGAGGTTAYGGGGGSGYIGGVTSATTSNGVRSGNGLVTIRSVDYEWWNASTSQWVSTETWNTSVTESVTFPADSWTNGAYEWSVAVENNSAQKTDYALEHTVTVNDPPPSAPTLLYPGNGSAVNFGNNQRFSWTFNDSGDTQSAYALKRQEIDPAPQENELPISSQIDTSTASTATAYSNQRKIDRTQNGVLWAMFWNGTASTTAAMEFWYSTDNGRTWNDPGSSSYFGFFNTSISYTPNASFFIDADDYAHVAYKDAGDGMIYYRRGVPNAARTTWTWSTRLTIGGTTANYPDIVAHREGTGWKAHMVYGTVSGSTYPSHVPITITSGGAISNGSATALGGAYANTSHTYPSIDFNHTGDGKTVAGGSPNLYVAWSAGQTGAGNGIRFKKAAYSGGAWTWGTEREIDSTRYIQSNDNWINCVYDGTSVQIVAQVTSTTNDFAIYERDAADTTTTTRINEPSSANTFYNGSASYDSARNIYVAGRRGSGWGYRKFTRSGLSLSGGTNVEIDSSSTSGRWLLMRRGYGGDRIDMIYTDGSASPYQVKMYGFDLSAVAPTSTTIDANATLSDATADSSRRLIDRTQNGVMWMISRANMNSWYLQIMYSTDNGKTWTYPGDTSSFQTTGFSTSYVSDPAFFIDIDDYAHIVYADMNQGYLMYRRGTPNAARTSWTWSSAYTLQTSNSQIKDLVAHREGTGWKVHVIGGMQYFGGNRVQYIPITITSGGTITPGTVTDIGGSYGDYGQTYPSLDFNHTGDGKTVAGSTPHLYAAWSAGTTGAGYGIRFRKATYSGGSWTWGTEREIDSTRYYVNGAHLWLSTLFDGTRVIINGIVGSSGSSYDLMMYERDAADTTTTTRTLVAGVQSGTNIRAYAGSMTYDSYGNVYILGWNNNGSTPYNLGLLKWDRETNTLGSSQVLDTITDTTPEVSFMRGHVNNRINAVYSDGGSPPYSVKYWGHDLYIETGGEQWWNAGTSSWSSTEVWNTSVNGYVDFAPGAWALDTNYQWSVATKDSSDKVGPYSAWNEITVPQIGGFMRHGKFFTETTSSTPAGHQPFYFRWFDN